ncbi:MAG TPA: MerR family transcriptional regulator [Candidatus Dormibacteraeota bacterium]|nr:MerR family transcriptional regulator [Candidatus Dormibacteraeota bacterium]
MRSGQLALRAGVNVETLRYYERRGLLEAPARLPSGYRAYDDEAVRIIRFIKRAQELGFTLAEVETLLELAAGGPDTCDAAQSLAGNRIADLARRIEMMRRMRDSLERLVATCQRPRRDRECPLIQSIEQEGE